MGLAESAGGKKRRNDRKLEEKKSKDVVNEIAEDEDEDEDEKEDEEAECEDDECGERERESRNGEANGCLKRSSKRTRTM